MEWTKNPDNSRPESNDMRVTHQLARIFLAAVGLGLAAPAAAQSYIKTDTIEYNDDLSKWVVGQVRRTTTDGTETERTEFNANVQPVKTYVFGRLQQTLTYNTDGTLATASDGRDGISGAETTITLSSWKRGIPQNIHYPATPESPSGATESANVLDDGTIGYVIDETGNKTCYTYDAMGRLSAITYPSESAAGVCKVPDSAGDTSAWNPTLLSFAPVASSEYGIPSGHWKQTVSTGNGRKVVYFDALWRPLVEESYDNASPSTTRSATVKRYDLGGHLAFQAYPRASLTDYADTTLTGTKTTYDALDRVTQVYQDSELGTLTTTSVYETGFKTKVTNPRNKSTTTSYMTYDEPTTDWPVAIVHPEGAYTDIARDVFTQPLSVTRRNADGTTKLTRRYVYGTLRRLCMVIEPETGTTVFNYDGADNLTGSAAGLPMPTGDLTWPASGSTCGTVWASGSSRRVNRTYDARNRLTALTFPDGLGNTTHSYTPDGLLASVTADNGGTNQVTTNYTYNRRRSLIGERMLWSAIDWPITYGYNANGHLASQVWHGLTVDYAPNALGQPTKAATYVTGVSYYPNGALKQFTYGNGIVHTLTQNARGLPDTSKDAYSTTSFLNDAYDYDANGNVAAITDGATGTNQRGNRTMTYDGLDRLKTTASVMYGATGASYTYDVLDNLARVTVGGAAARDHYYCYDTNWRLTNVKTGSCTGTSVIGLGYDVQGNLNNKNGTTFTFDYGNRLRSVSGSPASSYVYDAAGRRVRDYTTASKYSQYSQSGQLMQTSDARKNIFSEYIYLGGSLVAIRERDTTTNVYTTKYQHTDALGSPVVVTDANRVVLERNEYEPFGKVIAPAVAKDGPGFTGHVLDAATGMNYMQQRYYDPGIGRFLSVDPVAVRMGGDNFNRYAYAFNNPYKFTDPDGRDGLFNRPEYRMAQPTGEGAGLIADFLPVVGDIKGVVEAVMDPTLRNISAAGVGLIPVVGDLGAKVIKGADHVADAARALPDSATVCRGGACTADRFASGSGVSVDSAGKLQNVSVNSAPGKSVAELSQGIPNKQVGVTTVGDVRKAGGDVVPSPTRGNPDHCTMCGVTPAQAEKLFTPTVRNPNL